MGAALRLHPWLKDRCRYLLADAGYHAGYNHGYLAQGLLPEESLPKDSIPEGSSADDIKIIPIIAIPRPKEDDKGRRLHGDGIHDENGLPVCVGGRSMEFVGTGEDGAHHFRCPPEGCHLKNKLNWSRHCHDEHSEKPEHELLRIMGIVHRASDEWQEIFKKRPIIERLFSSGKQTRLLDKHQALGRQRVSLHGRLATLSHLLTSWGRLMASDYDRMRRMTIKLPRATRAAELNQAQGCAHCRLCSHHDQ